MNKKIEIISAMIVLTVVGLVVLYPKYQAKKATKEAAAVADKAWELDQLVLKDQDCVKVLENSALFLKTHPDAVPIWNLKGACEFDLGNFAAAKASFDKVLSLQPDHQAAKNYLKNLETVESHANTVVTATELPYDRAAYEAKTGLKFNDQILRFERVVKHPSNIPEFLRVTYTRLGSFADSVSHIKTEFEKTSTQVSRSDGEGITVFSTRTDTDMKMIVIEQATTTVVVEYQKFK